MLKIKSLILILVLIIGIVSNVFANSGGGDPNTFLKLGVGARAIGMGGAFVSIADDGTTAYWNPAGLAVLMKKKKGTSRINLSSTFGGREEMERKYYYLGSIFPVDFIKATSEGMGISLLSLTVGDIEVWEPDPETGFPTFKHTTLDNTEKAVIVSYGIELQENIFYMGVSSKFITHNIGIYSAKGMGIDIGFLADVSAMFYQKGKPILGVFDEVRIGMVRRRNFETQWDNSSYIDDKTLTGEIGICSDICWNNNKIGMVSSSLTREKSRPLYLSVGGEINIKGISLRSGINRWYIEKPDSGLNIEKLNYGKTLCAGFGCKVRTIEIDYVSSFARIETRHQVSTEIRF